MRKNFPKVLVIVAGVPAFLSKEFEPRLAKIKEGRRRFVWAPSKNYRAYEPDYVEMLYSRFVSSWREIFFSKEHNGAGPPGFEGVITIYLDHDGGNAELLCDLFEVETLTIGIPVPKILTTSPLNPNKLRDASNKIVKNLRKAIRRCEKVLPVIAKEINSNDNKTPLLLPDRNYGTKEIRELIKNVSESVREPNPYVAVRTAAKKFGNDHPRVAFDKRTRKHFINGKGVVFHSPGSDRHGAPSLSGNDHHESCLVRGRLRLGAAYDPRFHYDCVKSKGALASEWRSCHNQDFALPKGRDHVNIAPNDHVR